MIHIECMLGHAWAGRPVLLSIVTDLDIYIYILDRSKSKGVRRGRYALAEER